MKKSILAVILAVTFGSLANAQVKSVTMLSAKSIIEAAEITHADTTVSANDVYWTRIEVASDQKFSSSFFTKWVMRTGIGTFTDVIYAPLVYVGVSSFVRVQATSDTLGVTLKSIDRVVTPKHTLENPTIYYSSKNPTVNGIIEQMGYKTGYADSAIITHDYALDKDFVYKSNPKKWKVYADGFLSDTLSGLKDYKKFWDRWIITTYFGSKTLNDTFWTLQKSKTPWLAKPADTVRVTNSTIEIKSRTICYGSTGTLWATINGITVTSILPLSGVGQEYYRLLITGLAQNTTYTVCIHVKTAIGIDSFFVTKTTDKFVNPSFTLYTSAVKANPSKIQAWAVYNVPAGKTATISVGLFDENDSLCTGAMQDSTYVVSQGTGTLYKTWKVAPGTYWAWFWGTCSDGQYMLDPKPMKVKVTQVAGINEFKTQKISVYPNPAKDWLYSSENITLFNSLGEKVGSGTQIFIENLPSGFYFYKALGSNTYSGKILKE